MYETLSALILNERITAEADKLVIAFTREHGKISLIVPGAKKIQAKLSGITEPVMESQVMVYRARAHSRPKVTGGTCQCAFVHLRRRWQPLVTAQCCGEITNVLTAFGDPHKYKYELLSRTWQLLEQAQHPARIFAAFTLRFLKLTGYSFLEFIKREGAPVSAHDVDIIHILSTQSGDHVDDMLDIDSCTEQRILRAVYGYLTLYVPWALTTKKLMMEIASSPPEVVPCEPVACAGVVS